MNKIDKIKKWKDETEEKQDAEKLATGLVEQIRYTQILESTLKTIRDGYGLDEVGRDIIDAVLTSPDNRQEIIRSTREALKMTLFAEYDLREVKKGNERLKETLKYYADPQNYRSFYERNAPVMIEKGERARMALEGRQND